ncbi:MAG: phosphoribosylaminoimidazolesuccinocarboxamide synthase [Thermocrispum sp.]
MKHLHSGKVRDVYQREDGDLVLVASDRVSVYDVVLPTPIPGKGELLTRLSVWWFEQTADLFGNHLISATGFPPELQGRSMRCKPLRMVPVECVVRGYLAGSAVRDYQRDGAVSGVRLPAGLVEGDRLPEPVFTPSSKAPHGEHDAPITFARVVDLVGEETAARLRDVSLALYRMGAARTAAAGLVLADTKLEFGFDATGELVLGDELLTSDSSRYWPADEWRPGGPQPAFDKQFVRDWAAGTGWDKTPPGPQIPGDVVAATRERYVAAYQRLTGQRWARA